MENGPFQNNLKIYCQIIMFDAFVCTDKGGAVYVSLNTAGWLNL